MKNNVQVKNNNNNKCFYFLPPLNKISQNIENASAGDIWSQFVKFRLDHSALP